MFNSPKLIIYNTAIADTGASFPFNQVDIKISLWIIICTFLLQKRGLFESGGAFVQQYLI